LANGALKMFNYYFWQHTMIGVFSLLGADYTRFLITEMLIKFM